MSEHAAGQYSNHPPTDAAAAAAAADDAASEFPGLDGTPSLAAS